MQVCTDHEAIAWCLSEPRGLGLDAAGRLTGAEVGRALKLDMKSLKWRELPMVARALAFAGCHEESSFAGALLWVRTKGIALSESEAIVARMADGVRHRCDGASSLDKARATLFQEGESNDCSAMVLATMLAEWDAYLVHPSGGWWMLIHHDDCAYVSTTSPHLLTKLRGSLQAIGPVSEGVVPPLTS